MAKGKGSNDLNLLLKAKVVKIQAELDLVKSMPVIRRQVDEITKKLDDKPVKLRVELKATMVDLNNQMRALRTKLNTSKSIKPIKIGVEIDVTGSASEIKKQLREIHETVEDFNKKYSQQIKKMQETTAKANPTKDTPSGASVDNVLNAKQYVNTLKEAETILRNTHGKKGFFSSDEIKDAEGNLKGFVATLTKSNGVIQKVRYGWDKDKETFLPINQQTITNSEKAMKTALNSLRELDREILKLGKDGEKYRKEADALEKRYTHNTLTQDAVNGLKSRINDEKAILGVQKKESDELREQKKLLAEIGRAKRSISGSKNQEKLSNLRGKADLGNTLGAEELADIKHELSEIKKGYTEQISKEKELGDASKRRLEVLNEIKRLERTTVRTKGANSNSYIAETKRLAESIVLMRDYTIVKQRMDATNRQQSQSVISEKTVAQLEKLKKAMTNYALATGQSLQTIETRYEQVAHNVKNNLQEATNETKRFTRLLDGFNLKQKLDQKRNSIVPISDEGHGNVAGLIKNNDIDGLRTYIGELNNAKVATLKLATDSKGLSRITATMEGAGKTTKQFSYEIDNVNKKLRAMGQADVFNRNANLGVFEQLRIAMARVPVWMTAMTAFYGTINGVRAMTREILEVDSALTELKRVADSHINIDVMFQGALEMSGKLGNNIHDVMQSVNDLARTYGHFNERQLLAIANTSTLMANVSDLNAQEATESLVGTMNAFNKTAEESIVIVDALNEVDNNYAISTKQLSTGLAKSASTAKTFGVTMEENIGHITAIGSVTMESGNVIGNSLKTIYSRITTMAGAEEVLNNIGISITDMASGEVKDVNVILGELANKWDDITKAERQNIAVKIAGRYQLSRFLGLMNNYDTALEATATALTSEGSAMRENAEYLKSFEARINKLKTAFTEFSLSVGDAVLSGGMLAVIEGLTSLAKVGVEVVDTFGALPVVFLTIAGAMGKMGVLSKFHNTLENGLGYFGKTEREARKASVAIADTAGNVVQFGTKQERAMKGVEKSTKSATLATKGLGTAMKSALATTGIGLGFLALGYIIEKLVSKYQEAKFEQEELINLNEKMITSYRASGDGMESMISRYEKLSEKLISNKKLDNKEQSELNVLTAQFAELLPTTVEYIDANGKATLKKVEAMKEEIKAVAELSKQEAILKEMKFAENMEKEASSLIDIIEKTKELKETRDELTKSDGKTTKPVTHDSGYYVSPKLEDNTEELQRNLVQTLMNEASKTEAIQSTINAIQTQTLAYFEANGELSKLGDSQQKVIENFMSHNEELLRNASSTEEANQAISDLYTMGKKVGEVFSESFDIMTAGLEDKPELLAEIKNELGMVAESIPESFFKIDAEDMNKSMSDITRGLKEIVNVSTHIEAGSTDFDGLSLRLQKTGLTSDQAGDYISKLAREHDNLLLRQDAYSQGFDGLTEDVEGFNEAVLDTIDVTELVFGYSSSDLSAVKSHIEALEVLKQVHKDGAEGTEEWKVAIGGLAEFLNLTETEVEGNLHYYNQLVTALQEVKIKTDENGSSYLDIYDKTSNLTQAQRELLQAWIDSGASTDFLTGANKKVVESNEEVAKSYDKARVSAEEPFQIKVPPFQNDVVNELHKVVETKNKVQGALNDTSKAIQDTAKSATSSAEETQTAGNKIMGVFESLARAVDTRINNMITDYQRQGSAIDALARKARSASRDLENMNSSSSRASSSGYARPRATFAQSISNVDSENVANAMSTYSSSVGSTFSATSGEGGMGISSGGFGTSGILQPSFTSLHLVKEPTSSRVSATASKTSSKEELAELYSVDNLERQSQKIEAIINNLRAKLEGLNVNTKQYRNTLQDILKYETSHYQIIVKQLKNLEARNVYLEKRLKQLSNVSKHTKAERDEYNKLQQEYDSNLGNIASLRAEVTKSMIELKKNAEAIFGDFVDEILSKIEKSIKAIDDRIDNIDFKIEVLDLTSPEDIDGKLQLIIEKTDELIRQKVSLEQSKKLLENELRNATKMYGANSEIVKRIIEEINAVDEALEDTTLNIIRSEKEVRDIRGEVADDIIDSLKDQYKKQEEMALNAIDNQIKEIEKAHKVQMEIYDEEIEKINEVYDAKFKEIDDKADKEDFDAELAEKNANISDLTSKRALLAGDTSLEGKKRLAELDEELKKAQEELDKFLRDHQNEQLKEKLEADRDAQVQEIEDKQETAEKALEILLERLGEERDAISLHYSSILDNEQHWATVRGELIKGNFGVLETELIGLGMTIDQLTNGTFDTLSSNFANFSAEVQAFVNQINSMVGQINTPSPSSPSNGSGGKSGQVGGGIASHQIPYIINKAKNGIALDEPTPDKTHLYNLIKNSSIPEAQMAEIYKKALAGTPLAEPTPEKNRFYDLFQELIKKKMTSLETGGYTGNWSGNGGKMAILHKKEIVLNDRQTKDILNTAKLMDKIRTILPIFKPMNASNIMNDLATSSGVTNEYNLEINIDKLNGDKEGANLVVKEVIKGLKKMGK